MFVRKSFMESVQNLPRKELYLGESLGPNDDMQTRPGRYFKMLSNHVNFFIVRLLVEALSDKNPGKGSTSLRFVSGKIVLRPKFARLPVATLHFFNFDNNLRAS